MIFLEVEMSFLRFVFRDQKITRVNPQLTLGELYDVPANDLACVCQHGRRFKQKDA